jgi:hypothetical protein
MRQTADIVPIGIKQKLVCSKCGAPGEGSCHCGKPYLPALERAAEAIEVAPEKSNRVIAEEEGISHTTVVRARKKSGGTYVPPEKRKGKDGKSYSVKKRKEKEPYVPCKPILTKDPLVNEALLAVFDHIVTKGWSDRQLELFFIAVRKLHSGVKKYGLEWHEAVERRKQEKRLKRQSKNQGERHVEKST